MQGDLISRQAVIDIIHKEIEKTSSFAEHETQINIEMAVQELPCAYDMEKVVAELENEIYEAKTMWEDLDYYHGQEMAFEIAKEIVIKGGIENDSDR